MACWWIPGSIPARAGETGTGEGCRSQSKVYPRTGGGNVAGLRRATVANGLSPHGRGKRRRVTAVCGGKRSIPARAGETISACASSDNAGVYPRTGGGNINAVHNKGCQYGLSPHGRGKLAGLPDNAVVKRSIPARAGETGIFPPMWRPGGVYPRTGGGNMSRMSKAEGAIGLSPHGRGKP